MNGNDAVLAVVAALEATGIPSMLVGSYASNTYGIDRATQDADLVIDPGEASLSSFFRSLPSAIRFDPQMSFETVTLTRRHVAEVVGTEFKIELFYLSQDPHDRERFRRRREIQLAGNRVWILSAEDVLVTKLRWARAKDRMDVRDVIAVQGDAIDWPYVYTWCDCHGTRALLDEIRASIPPL